MENEVKLKFYALYKQATEGDLDSGKNQSFIFLFQSFHSSPIFLLFFSFLSCFFSAKSPKPGVFDLKGRYKWDAWNELKGILLLFLFFFLVFLFCFCFSS